VIVVVVVVVMGSDTFSPLTYPSLLFFLLVLISEYVLAFPSIIGFEFGFWQDASQGGCIVT